MSVEPLIEKGTPAFRRACLALTLASLVVFANLYAIHPLLPLIAETFQITSLQASSVFTLTNLTLACSLLVHGPLSDAIGRKGPLLAGITATLVLNLAMAYTTDYSLLLWLRAALGICLGVLPAVAIAYLGDSMSRKAMVAAVGLYIAGNTVGGAGGRLAGGFIGEHLGLQAVFLSLAAFTLLGLICVAILLPRPAGFLPQRLSPAGSFQSFIDHLCNRQLLPAFLLGGCNFMIFINLYTYLTFRLSAEPWQLGAGALGLLFLTYLAGTFSAALSGRLNYGGGLPGMAIGVLLLIGGCLITLSEQLWLILAGLLCNAFGFFLTHSLANAWINQHATHSKASASSLYSVFYYLGSALGVYYLEPFWRLAGWPSVVAGSLLVLLINLGLIVYLRRKSFPA
ncbi:MFS transporter [Pseudomonas sp. NyZ704]|nr:MFS transporter [Pseudomonas sp. NyZ704]